MIFASVPSSVQVLRGAATLEESGLQSGDVLTLQLRSVQVCGSKTAFAAILGDESAASKGSAPFGGDSSAVQGRLQEVKQIQATGMAFAAILANGSLGRPLEYFIFSLFEFKRVMFRNIFPRVLKAILGLL